MCYKGFLANFPPHRSPGRSSSNTKSKYYFIGLRKKYINVATHKPNEDYFVFFLLERNFLFIYDRSPSCGGTPPRTRANKGSAHDVCNRVG